MISPKSEKYLTLQLKKFLTESEIFNFGPHQKFSPKVGGVLGTVINIKDFWNK